MTLEVGEKHLNRFEKEFCLSDKINCLGAFIGVESGKQIIIHIEDAKEFIVRELMLIAELVEKKITQKEFLIKRDKLIGEKLI